MVQKRYWLTLYNFTLINAIRYREEKKEIRRGDSAEWQVFIHIDEVDLARFPASEDMIGRSYWEYGARVNEAKELVARNVLLSLNVRDSDIVGA
ncbi:hypothetical protein FS837_002187 [Tulasnella sp. UAMH 9824]|nr:hypothetical protein FS837_002187 [Tulasnella sp. UAMH 9824]